MTSTKLAFDERKLEENKQEIATILQELGIDEHPSISLASLTTLKSGEVWNRLQSLEDFYALDCLLACSDACGFIYNDVDTRKRNINKVGDINSVLISRYGRFMVGDDDNWVQLIRENVVNNMYFLTAPESIKVFATGNQGATKNIGTKYN